MLGLGESAGVAMGPVTAFGLAHVSALLLSVWLAGLSL